MARTRIFYMVAVVLAGVFTLGFGSTMSFLVLYSVLLLPLLSLFSILRYKSNVKIDSTSPQERAFKGDTLPYTLTILNKGLLPYPAITLKYSKSPALLTPIEEDDGDGDIFENTVSLPSKARIKRQYNVTFPYRGDYRIGLSHTRAVDFLGLFSKTFDNGNMSDILVFPQIIPEFTLPPPRRQTLEGPRGMDFATDHALDISDVRKHDLSDDYRKIHWKLTAKKNEFIVKNFEILGLTHSLVIPDTAAPSLKEHQSLSLQDLITSLCASALSSSIGARRSVKMVYSDTPHTDMPVLTHEQMERALEILARLPFEDEADILIRRLSRILSSKDPFADIAVFAQTITHQLALILKDIFVSGHEVYLYLVLSSEKEPTKEEYRLIDDLQFSGIFVEIVK